jgi:hypothetical protein
MVRVHPRLLPFAIRRVWYKWHAFRLESFSAEHTEPCQLNILQCAEPVRKYDELRQQAQQMVRSSWIEFQCRSVARPCCAHLNTNNAVGS